MKKKNNGFTIVELLVVIVVIGILASITIVSYSGISNRANITTIQAELSGSSKKMSIYYTLNGSYPTTLDANGCPSAPVVDTTNCIKFGSSIEYTYVNKSPSTYEISASKGDLSYKVTENSAPVEVPSPWIRIGSQSWARANLNVGTMINGINPQTNNGGTNVVEKYCYNDLLSNCDTYGAYYQWEEAMTYSSVEGAQGICPAGSHIPTDNDWKILESSLGMAQVDVDKTGWRGTDQSLKIRVGGSSGFEMKFSGYRHLSGSFNSIDSDVFFWTSSTSASLAWHRDFYTGYNTINRNAEDIRHGFAIRCIKN